ncbi:MAG: hypothetical protein AAF945_09175 [Actinomycetota bacterium]
MYVTATPQVPPPAMNTSRGPVLAAPPDGPVRTDDEVHHARLEAIVEMIRRLTGRDVEFVPPAPYIVSGPARPEPVELDVVTRRRREMDESEPDESSTPVRVDITDVVERGTTPRMQLVTDTDGSLSLHPQLDIEA